MKRCVTFFLIFMVAGVLFAEKVNDRIEKRSKIEGKTYNWESGSTEFVNNDSRDSRSVPSLIDYQGKITDSSSNPITSSVSITFTIYDAATSGNNLWDESHSSVTPVDGLVHVLLGSVDVIGSSLFDGNDRWLGIKIGSDSEMTPRLRIVSVPYAIYAQTAETDNDWTISGSYSLAAGSNNTVVSAYSLAHGLNNNITTNGHYATALGANNTINRPYSLAAGSYNSIDGSYAIALGRYLTAQAYNSFAIGKYNVVSGTWDTWVDSEPLFILGNGSDASNRSNALTVFKDGRTTIGSATRGEMLTVEGTVESTTGGFKFPDGTTQTTASGAGVTEIDDLSDGKSDGSSISLGSGAGLYDDGTLNDNIEIGKETNHYNVSGTQNTIIGVQAGRGRSFGTVINGNVFLGYRAGYNNIGYNNIFIGKEAGPYIDLSNKLYIENSDSGTPLIYGDFTDGSEIVKINGNFQATGELQDSNDDAGTSGQILSSTVTGTDWIDPIAEINNLTDGKTGGYSVFLGSGAGTNDDGTNNMNVGVGIGALSTNLSGFGNTANGYHTLLTNLTGHRNTAIGYSTLSYNSIGNDNTAIGFNALTANTGSGNTAFGSYALDYNTVGEFNVGIGYFANAYNQAGYQNTIIGYEAGGDTGLHDKSENVFLGYRAGYTTEGSSNVFLGCRAGYNETEDDKLYIENSDSATPLIYGDFSTDKVTINDVLKLAPRSGAPTNPTEGEIYINSTDNHIYCYLGGAWKQLDN